MSQRMSIARWMVAVAVFGLSVSACSGEAADSGSVVHQRAVDLQRALQQAISATEGAIGGFASPVSASAAVVDAESEIATFESAAFSLAEMQAATTASELVLAGRMVVGALREGDVVRAKEMMAFSVVPRVDALVGVQSAEGSSVSSGTGGIDGAAIATIIGAAIVILGVAAFLTSRFRGRETEPEPSPPSPTQGPGFGTRRAEPAESSPYETADLSRTTQTRLMDVELKSLLEKAVDQVHEANGWVVPVISSEIQVLADPLRLQRVVVSAIGAAFLRGAHNAGVVVETSGDKVVISIGDDGEPVDHGAGEGAVAQLEERARQAFGGWRVTATWYRQDGVTMFNIAVPHDESALITSDPFEVELS